GTLPQIQRPMQQVAPTQQLAPKQLSVQPPTFFFPSQPVRNFAQAPPPERYIQPGIQGVYAQLRAFKGKGLTELKLKPYEPYHSPVTPPDPAHFYLRQIVVKFVEGSGVRLRAGNLVVSEEPAATETRARLGRFGLEPAMVAAD